MLEALWSVTFIVPTFGSYGAGVVVLENGTVRGGDSTYYYVGNFRVKDDVVTADVSINHYFGPLNNVFGNIEKTQVSLSGKPDYESFELTGKSTDLQIPIAVRFKRIAELSA
ncbi:MAG: hypothetical protein A3I83_06715 [Methylotenera sp. RIFCSPLOWO2_02_FULL_45_14]|nr:MAG: hypothetical protein A3I83_06715 [Methylotenera sp. RIFCSPLOWO2_02_FULL_45_14]